MKKFFLTVAGLAAFGAATSAVAAGKVSLAVSRNESIPVGWVVDRDGKPTTDPND